MLYKKYINEDDSQIFYYDKLFEKLLEDNSYKDLVIIIHYIVSRIEENNYLDEDGNYIENKFGYFQNAILNNIKKLSVDLDNLYEEGNNEFEIWIYFMI